METRFFFSQLSSIDDNKVWSVERTRRSRAMAPREDRIVILTTGSRTTRAGYAIHELLQKPSAQISTRAARRTNGHGENEWIVGEELDGMLQRHEEVHVIYPIRGGKVRDWDALVAVW